MVYFLRKENTLNMDKISLVIFVCEGREHLLYNTIHSFKKACNYEFSKIILAADGPIDNGILKYTGHDILIQSPKRKGYVANIVRTLPLIDTEYFFWLEDDWDFNGPVQIDQLLNELEQHQNWAQIVYSKYGPLEQEWKSDRVGADLYKNIYGFSANPCLCKTSSINAAFAALIEAPKGDKPGEDGFENFLTAYFNRQGLICAIHDPVDHTLIAHTGYLESTPRNWHMTNSLNEKTKEHLLTMPVPSLWRRLRMVLKLAIAFSQLTVKQLVNNEVYELCFRIISSAKSIKKNER